MNNPVSPAEILKLIPENREAEMGLLGALIVNDQGVPLAIKTGITRASFGIPAHAEIMAAIVRLHADKRPVDLLTLVEELKRVGRLKDVGDVDYLAMLAESVPGTSPESAAAYADIVLSTARRRTAALAARRFADAAVRGDVNGELSNLRSALETLEHGVQEKEVSQPKTLAELRDLAAQYAEEVKIPLGLPGIDETLQGSLPGHIVVVGAFSGHGKTTLCVQQAVHKAKLGHPVLLVTCEIGELEMGAKVEAAFEDPYETLPGLRVWAPLGDIQAVVDASSAWADGQTDAQLCPVLVIDYIQKLQPPSGIDNRERQVAVVCEALQSLGRRKRILIVAAAQLNRKSQEDKPALHHLRESGLIEQVADLAVLVAKPSDATLWATVAKNRWGRSGQETELKADYPASRFELLPSTDRYKDLAAAVQQFLAGEKGGKAPLRKVYRSVWWNSKHPSKGDIESAAKACGGFRIQNGDACL